MTAVPVGSIVAIHAPVCQAKRSFDSRRQAKAFARATARTYRRLLQHAYHCPCCGAWHLTSPGVRSAA